MLKLLLLLALSISSPCLAAVDDARDPPSGPASGATNEDLGTFLYKLLAEFRATQDIDAAASKAGIGSKSSAHAFRHGITAQITYRPESSLRISFEEPCIELDNVLRYVDEAGFGLGYVVPGEERNGAARLIQFSYLTNGKRALIVNVASEKKTDCVRSVSVQ